ncbi:MAG: tRNA-dihydrouridine synthase [Candidatus Rokuibacteriota bacterium]
MLGYDLDSPLGIAAGPLLNSKWVEGYARLGFDVLTYATVRSRPHPAHTLPNIKPVDDRQQVATNGRSSHPGNTTIAVSLGLPSMEPEVWRKDIRRATDRLRPGQILVASVVGTPAPDEGQEGFIADYAQCAQWAAEAGADVIEVHLAIRNPFGEAGQMLYENVVLSAQILHRVRSSVGVPVLAKIGIFRSPRALHEAASRVAPWTSGFVLVHGIPRRVVDASGHAAFEGNGREWATVVGSGTFPVAYRHIAELLAWRRAGEWPHAVLAVGGITTVARAQQLLREGANAVLVATAALADPLFATRFRQTAVSAVA